MCTRQLGKYLRLVKNTKRGTFKNMTEVIPKTRTNKCQLIKFVQRYY